MKLRYFAWVRTHIGLAGETIAKPDHIETLADLVIWLRDRGPGYAAAFARPELVRIAVNQHFTPTTSVFSDEDEIALFPPTTGG